MSRFVDRRLSGRNRSAVNRQRFLRRFEAQIRKAVADAVSSRRVADVERGERISIPAGDLSEPVFQHGPGGRRTAVHPGNRDFVPGDLIDRPRGGGSGAGGGGAGQGEDDDEFAFELSTEEFMDFFFQDLALPDLVKKQLRASRDVRRARAGFVRHGNPANLSVVRSMKRAVGRRVALSAAPREALREAERALDELVARGDGDGPEAARLRDEIDALRARIAAVPFVDTGDLRYANLVDRREPTTRAVMFCLMDVSGSMDETRKNVARRFFMLLHLFLKRSYEHVDVVFVRHHTVAREVGEHDFFHTREGGGTVASSALKLMREIVLERYPTADWNVYGAQASDGDNWDDDSPQCRDLLLQGILPLVQHFAYVEIAAEEPRSLWREYEQVRARSRRFAMRRIEAPEDIYPVFRDLFRKKAA